MNPANRYASAILAATLLGLAGCATTPADRSGKPPEIRAGAVLDLLELGSERAKVRLVSDAGDRIHVLVAAEALAQVLHVVVGPGGVVARGVVRSGVSPSNIDATFDGEGRLHLLLDSEHLVLVGDEWRASTPTAWQGAGVAIERPGFVHDAGQLAWTFTVFGAAIGAAPGRWVWRGGGGGYPAGGFLLYPWHERTRKAMLVADDAGGKAPWNVLDPQSTLDTLIVDAVADSAGNVHLVYATGHNVDLAGTGSLLGGIVTRGPGRVSYHYGRVAAQDLRHTASFVPDAAKRPNEIRAMRGIDRARPLEVRPPLAVDPATGSVLLGHWWLVEGDRWTDVRTSSPFAPYPGPVQVASAGSGSFHAIAVGNIDRRFAGRSGIEYAMLSAGEWSSSVWLSTAGSLSLMGPKALGMVGTASGNAFVAWTTPRGLVGRWVERVRNR